VTTRSGPPGGYGPRPGSGEPISSDLEKTPTVLHAKPERVPTDRRFPPPAPSTLAALGRGRTSPPPLPRVDSVPLIKPGPYQGEHDPTPSRVALANRHMRNYMALSPEHQRLVDAMTLALRDTASG
jgi:hypothetical protein